jgi:hypothetical protein
MGHSSVENPSLYRETGQDQLAQSMERSRSLMGMKDVDEGEDDEFDEEGEKISYNEDNEGLKSENVTGNIFGLVKASKWTRSQAAIDTPLLELAAQYVPPELLQRDTDVTKRLHIGRTFAIQEKPNDFDERLRSIQWVVETLIKDFKFDTFFRKSGLLRICP